MAYKRASSTTCSTSTRCSASRTRGSRSPRARSRSTSTRWWPRWSPPVARSRATGRRRSRPTGCARRRPQEWRQAHDWLVGRGETTPWDQLRRTINGAVDLAAGHVEPDGVRAVGPAGPLERLPAPGVPARRGPRLRPGAVPPRLRHVPARHLAVPDPDEDQLESSGTQSWWSVPGLLMDRTLRLPSSRSAGQGRTPRIPDTTQARQLARLEAEEDAKAATALRDRLLALDGKRLAELQPRGRGDARRDRRVDRGVRHARDRRRRSRPVAAHGQRPRAHRRADAAPPAARGCGPRPASELDDLALEVRPA